jgi:predicted NAD/FAD-dependent oxidoreductase
MSQLPHLLNGKNSKMKSDQKGIAIIGGGVAGLTAAHFIRQEKGSKFPITIFESSERVGGRLYRSTNPPGEHGARYLLKSELDVKPDGDYWGEYGLPDGTNIRRLFRNLGIDVERMKGDWPHCCMLNPFELRKLDPTGMKWKGNFRAAARVIKTLQRKLPSAPGNFVEWIQSEVRSEKSRKVLKMIVAGETCAPPGHVSAQYALECLRSAVNADETWYTIEGGSDTLIKKLSRSSAGNIQRDSTCLKVRKTRHNAIEVTYRNKTGKRKTMFQGVIISTPDGHNLVRQSSEPHRFHSYISILFSFKNKPRLRTNSGVDLQNGLYTDHPMINYLEAEKGKKGKHRWVLRILIPDAERFRDMEDEDDIKDEEIKCACLKVLENELQIEEKLVGSPSFKRWKHGLPCGGTSQKYEKVSEGICLCGDRFGRWPSMAAAIVSGAAAADAILTDQ